jgi:hypothetical protein
VDYPAMLLLPLQLVEAEPRAPSTLQDAYRQVLVDEVQTRALCNMRCFSSSRIATWHSSAIH